MAGAPRPTPPHAAVDARTSCPVCGGSIHPVAGRCKHCKADLVKLRQHDGAPPPVFPPPAPPPTGAPVAAAVGLATSRRPGAIPVAPPPARSRWSRRWPVLVAAIAMIAIAVSVVLLVTGESKGEARPRRAVPPPAPERMNVDPLPAPSTPDPWNAPAPPPSVPADPDPAPGAAPPPSADPGGAAAVPDPDQLFDSMVKAACTRLASCGNQHGLKDVCEDAAAISVDADTASRIRSGQCHYQRDLAERCLQAIGRIPCPTDAVDFKQMLTVWMSIYDCVHALECP